MKIYLNAKARKLLKQRSVDDGFTPNFGSSNTVEVDSEVISRLLKQRQPGESLSATVIRLLSETKK